MILFRSNDRVFRYQPDPPMVWRNRVTADCGLMTSWWPKDMFLEPHIIIRSRFAS